MGLDTSLEERAIILTLPPEVWNVLDSTNKRAIADGRQGIEAWIASLIMTSVLDCLDTVLASANSQEYNA
jgi:hypothetical protein